MICRINCEKLMMTSGDRCPDLNVHYGSWGCLTCKNKFLPFDQDYQFSDQHFKSSFPKMEDFDRAGILKFQHAAHFQCSWHPVMLHWKTKFRTVGVVVLYTCCLDQLHLEKKKNNTEYTLLLLFVWFSSKKHNIVKECHICHEERCNYCISAQNTTITL